VYPASYLVIIHVYGHRHRSFSLIFDGLRKRGDASI
jgi:hypothetical protein